jgi:hypothetical protein
MDWLLNLSIPAMTFVVFALVYLVTALIYLVVTRLAVGERVRVFKAISPGMLPPMWLVFGLLIAARSHHRRREARVRPHDDDAPGRTRAP